MMSWALGLAVLIGVGGPTDPANGSEKNAKSAELQHRRWIQYYKRVAAGYEFRLDQDGNVKLKVSPKPIHVYSNPASGRDTHGAFFVWTRDGRAEAIGAIWSKLIRANGNRRYVNHEFQSLSLRPFTARGKDGLVWAPRVAGIELKPIPHAPMPAKSKPLRLAQMRTLARQFTGYHTLGKERPLGVLGQPLYRYKSTPEDVVDGAVFGLFMDWDPEIMLLIEARETDAGPKWHYGAGRFSNKPLRLQHKGIDVWSHPGNDFGSTRGPFYAVLGVVIRDAIIEK